MKMIYTDATKCAIKIAFDAHNGQYDKSGLPYILHPIHLAEQMTDETSIIVALLHDVVEDSNYTLEELSKYGLGKEKEEVIETLRLLTHDKSVPYMDYIEAIKSNPIARKVKIADLKHNSDLTRLKPTKVDLKRVEKYKQALEILMEADQEK